MLGSLKRFRDKKPDRRYRLPSLERVDRTNRLPPSIGLPHLVLRPIITGPAKLHH